MKTSSLVLAVVVAFAVPSARAEEPVPAPAGQGEVAPGDQVQVVLKDGQVMRGRLLERTATTVVLESSGARLTFPADAVRELTRSSGSAPSGSGRDPNRYRYLYSPSGFMLSQWEGYVSQTELIGTTVSLGVTDWLTLQVGTILPWLVYRPKSAPILFGAKVGGGLTDWLHVALTCTGLEMQSNDSYPAVGVAFATVTLGSEDLNLGVSVGKPFAISTGTKHLGSAFGSVSGVWRLANSIALVSENWLFPAGGENHWLATGAVRFIGDSLGVDVGLIKVQGLGLPLPWLDFTWHWH
jgi:hypothetical protein